MVVYEVLLSVRCEVASAFHAYLDTHVPDVMSRGGFHHAEVQIIAETSETQPDSSRYETIKVCYWAKSLDQIEQYLLQHAATMREEALNKFAGQFHATRQFYSVRTSLDVQ